MVNHMYSEKVMDHFSNPRNMGEIENASGVGTVGNAKCGDIMRMYLDIDENGLIQDVKFKTFGCGAAVATSSMATELVKGKTVQEALKITNKAVTDALNEMKIYIDEQVQQKSLYQIWLDAGNSGTIEDFLESLKGTNGNNGLSSYELAKINGFNGTLEEWLLSIQN